MGGVNTIWCGILLGQKTTKLFGSYYNYNIVVNNYFDLADSVRLISGTPTSLTLN